VEGSLHKIFPVNPAAKSCSCHHRRSWLCHGKTGIHGAASGPRLIAAMDSTGLAASNVG
jgi:hypothetical protein